MGAAAINRDLRQLRSVFNRAVRRGELTENPFSNFEKLAEEAPEIRTLTAEEMQRVCGWFRQSPLLQTFLLVSLQTGCRIRELAYLLAEDVDADAGWLMIRPKDLPDGRRWKPKSKASVRDVWLPPWLLQRMLAFQLRGKRFVWSGHLLDIGQPFGATFEPERFVRAAQRQVTACCDSLGIPRFPAHDLRRTQQTWLREHGWGDAVCLAVAGQNTGATVLRNHYWRPNHRRMTRPAFEDVATIFSAFGLAEGDTVGDLARLKPAFESGKFAHSHIG